MKISLQRKGEKRLLMTLDGEDLSLGDILQHELLVDKAVDFAGFVTPHPLLRQVGVEVSVSRGDPLDHLKKAAAHAADNASEILSKLQKALGSQGKKE